MRRICSTAKTLNTVPVPLAILPANTAPSLTVVAIVPTLCTAALPVARADVPQLLSVAPGPLARLILQQIVNFRLTKETGPCLQALVR